ncbi:MAG: hypothetical protein AAFN80_09405, partial [Pseudomonadota bacterium]
MKDLRKMLKSLATSIAAAVIFTLEFCTTATAQDLPEEVARLKQAVMAVPGIKTVGIGKLYLPDIAVSDLSLPGHFADLPIAALRRSNGALQDELLISIGFSIVPDESGMKAAEFLAWWVRDLSRSGDNMQLRAMALPPMAGARPRVLWSALLPSRHRDKTAEAHT